MRAYRRPPETHGCIRRQIQLPPIGGNTPGDADAFMLGPTTWTNVTRTGQLQIGVHYLHGVVEAVSIKATESTSTFRRTISCFFYCKPFHHSRFLPAWSFHATCSIRTKWSKSCTRTEKKECQNGLQRGAWHRLRACQLYPSVTPA